MSRKTEILQIYPINLLITEVLLLSRRGVLISETFDGGMKEVYLKIPCPIAYPVIFDFSEIFCDSKLTDWSTSYQIERIKILLTMYKKVFSNDPGRTNLIEHDTELILPNNRSYSSPIELRPHSQK